MFTNVTGEHRSTPWTVELVTRLLPARQQKYSRNMRVGKAASQGVTLSFQKASQAWMPQTRQGGTSARVRSGEKIVGEARSSGPSPTPKQRCGACSQRGPLRGFRRGP
jgi:hypothetical protein